MVELFDVNEFSRYAKTAPLVLYNPQFFPSPFLNEKKIKCVDCYAVGVKFQKVSIILKYQESWKHINCRESRERGNPKDRIDSSMRTFIIKFKNEFHAIKGTVEGDRPDTLWNGFY